MADARKSLTLPLIIAAVAAVALMVALIGAPDSNKSSSPAGESTSSNSASTSTPDDPFARRQPDDPLAKGEVDAPVVLVAYSEFQCPFCGKFANETLPMLIEQYVDTGALRIEWRDLPYLGEESFRAARAARAAAEQDAFWAYHDMLFGDQVPKPNSGHLTDDYLLGVATDLGLDVDQFEADYEAGAGEDAIRRDLDAGMRAGVNGTPAFFVNGTPVFGAQPLGVFVETIEAAAASS